MGPKCNIGDIEGAALFTKIEGYLSREEEQMFQEKFTPYIFYETWGTRNQRECYCTTCKRWYTVYKDEAPGFFYMHHNDTAHCPECGAEAELKSLGRLKTGECLRESRAGAFIRLAEGGAISITAGIGFKEYNIREWGDLPIDSEIEYCEKARYYLAPGRVKQWKRSIISRQFRAMYGDSPWRACTNISEPFQANPLYGYDNDYWLFGTENIEDSAFRYCQVEEWYYGETQNWLCEQDNTVKLVVSYLANYAMRPQMEMAVKMGLGRVCTDLCMGNKNGMCLNWKADKPWKFLKMSKADAKVFLLAPSLPLLRAYHMERKKEVSIGMKELSAAFEAVGRTNVEAFFLCVKRCGVTIEKGIAYISERDKYRQNRVQLWLDYLNMAERLGYDMSRSDVLMPQDLQERHDVAAEQIQLEKDELERKSYQARYRQLKKKYEFEMDGLRILVPVSGGEIVREGKTLHHCVGGYAPRHIKGDTTILFLRRTRKPGTSFITIEMTGMNGDEIRQIHGYQNERYKNAVSPVKKYATFLAAWLSWLRGGSKRTADGKPIMIQEDKSA